MCVAFSRASAQLLDQRLLPTTAPGCASPDTTIMRRSSTGMCTLLGKRAARARLVVLFPTAGPPTIRKMGCKSI